jgi:hypothetical protein
VDERTTCRLLCVSLLAVFTTACLGDSKHAPSVGAGSTLTPQAKAIRVVRASRIVAALEKASSVRLTVFSTSPGSTAIAVDLTPPVAVDTTLPAYDRGRSSTYHLSARGVRRLLVTVMTKGNRILYIAPEWTDTFKLVDAHWIGPDLGFPPAGGG